MRVVPKDFQTECVADLREKFDMAREWSARLPQAVLLNAPTGSGKTLIATALIEELLEGTEEHLPDTSVVFLWLTDQPQLNKQTADKMLSTSTVLTPESLTVIDGAFDEEVLKSGRVYFLNTQKLSVTSSLVRAGDDRTYPLWVTLTNTTLEPNADLVLIVDEAHRGAQGRAALEADTIFQKFMKGSPGEIPSCPLVLGISATPGRFVDLCNATARPLIRVDVDPAKVRESGLLKEFVDLYHPNESQPSLTTMLVEAASALKGFRLQWEEYSAMEAEAAVQPVLVVQVEDARRGATGASLTDLGLVVETLAEALDEHTAVPWIAHAFQDDTELHLAGHAVRYLAPSAIDADPDVKVVLFKTSLNTGWDCPRAEVMVSTRTARDETNIAQLVGRMVRAPLARRIDANEHLNSVALYLPKYDRQTVEKIVGRLMSPDAGVPPTEVRHGAATATLRRAADKDACFSRLECLPTYAVPRARPMRPVTRLAKLAGLLAEMGLVADPVKTYRRQLVDVLLEERTRLCDDEDFKRCIDEAAVLDVRRRRFEYGLAADEGGTRLHEETATTGRETRALVTDRDLDGLHTISGKKLGEGLHKEYIRRRSQTVPVRTAKLELWALVTTAEVLKRVEDAADLLRKRWTTDYKAAISDSEERYVQVLRDVEGAGVDPEVTRVVAPAYVEWTKGSRCWLKHLYVDEAGTFFDDLSASSWERKVVETETSRDEVVGWLRNLDRKPWSLCIPRRDGTGWKPFYPDFIFFRQTTSGIIADIVDPHYLMAEDMPQRAVALARYAQDHGEHYGRIEMVVYEGETDEAGRRLDLTDEALREKTANVTTREQLRELYSGT